MDRRIGQVIARLSEEALSGEESQHIERINSNISPETPVSAGDVYIRRMLVLSDRVNSFGGCFPAEEHSRLAELLVDSPVLVGHRKDSLPIGRTFHAEAVERDGARWVLSYFYWLKATNGAEDLRRQIDQGIVKECSIGFVFGRAECSICGNDIRECEHQPLVTYRVGGQERNCHFNYRDIRKVLETSLVYRGATPDTKVGAELAVPQVGTEHGSDGQTVVPPEPLSIANTDPLAEYLVMPRYEGLTVRLQVKGSCVRVCRPDGRELVDLGRPACSRRQHSESRGEFTLGGLLVGYRGKSRCSTYLVRRYLDGLPGPVSRLRLMLWPGQPGMESLGVQPGGRMSVDTVPCERVKGYELAQAATRLGSRDGVWVCSSSASGAVFFVTHDTADLDPAVHAWLAEAEAATWLILSHGDEAQLWRLSNASLDELSEGRGCLAERATGLSADVVSSTHYVGGRVTLTRSTDGAICLKSEEARVDGFTLQPVKLNGKRRYLARHSRTVEPEEVQHVQ
ncbi:hypothetical protein GF356_07910 [candidate division GN15 bacterium]|nr:hypothetical protein [candidate division GN15 bacterium]